MKQSNLKKEDLKKYSLKQLKAFPNPGDAFISILKEDSRKSVRDYANSLEKKFQRKKDLLEKTKVKQNFDFAFSKGSKWVIGIDEVGRGPLAGPVVTAAVILPKEPIIIGINDSKKVSKTNRKELAKKIKEIAIDYQISMVNSRIIDQINILNATKKCMKQSLRKINKPIQCVLIDALKLGTQLNEISIIKGDEKSYCIGAASILAKDYRDTFMEKISRFYPEYKFEKNVGYGTKEHIEAIKKFGLSPLHRRSFCHKLK